MRISHIGIAVKSLDEAIEKYGLLFNDDNPHKEIVDQQKVSVASYKVGESIIELTAATSEESPIAKFINNRGEGIHHLAFEVDDIQMELNRLKAKGAKLINETPKDGAHNMLIAFVHPETFNGVLVELCQKKNR